MVDALKSNAGQDALREFIYKICSNHRRRLRNLKERNPPKAIEMPKEGGTTSLHRDHVHIDSRNSEGSGGRPSRPPRMGPHLGSNLLCIVRPDGAVRGVCNLYEPAPSWTEDFDGSGDTEAFVNALSIEPLLCVLEKDHSYRRHDQRLGFVNYRNSQGGPDTLTVSNDRQFGAAVGSSLKRYSIDFKTIGDGVD
jgi:hypothetical protein